MILFQVHFSGKEAINKGERFPALNFLENSWRFCLFPWNICESINTPLLPLDYVNVGRYKCFIVYKTWHILCIAIHASGSLLDLFLHISLKGLKNINMPSTPGLSSHGFCKHKLSSPDKPLFWRRLGHGQWLVRAESEIGCRGVLLWDDYE